MYEVIYKSFFSKKESKTDFEMELWASEFAKELRKSPFIQYVYIRHYYLENMNELEKQSIGKHGY